VARWSWLMPANLELAKATLPSRTRARMSLPGLLCRIRGLLGRAVGCSLKDGHPALVVTTPIRTKNLLMFEVPRGIQVPLPTRAVFINLPLFYPCFPHSLSNNVPLEFQVYLCFLPQFKSNHSSANQSIESTVYCLLVAILNSRSTKSSN
jgi:hypothetical protein